MEITTRTKIIVAVVGMAACFGLGYYLTPTKTVTKTEVKEVIRIVEKAHTDQKNDTTIIEVETRYPDGTVKIERKTVDKNHIVVDVDKVTTNEKETVVVKTVERLGPDWTISGLASVNVAERRIGAYGLHVQRKILGPIVAGAFGMSDGAVGVSVGLTF